RRTAASSRCRGRGVKSFSACAVGCPRLRSAPQGHMALFFRAGTVGAAILTLVAGLATVRAASGGTIKGTAVLKGPAPEARKITVTIDQHVSGKEKNAEALFLSPQGRFRTAGVGPVIPPRTSPAAPPHP